MCIGSGYRPTYESINNEYAVSVQLIFSPQAFVCVVRHMKCDTTHRFHWRIYYVSLEVI